MYEQVCSPESLGIKSEDLCRFLDELKEAKLCLHGILLERGGRCCLQGYEKEFSAKTPHRMYSVSKTFVSAAIGSLITEGRLGLDDRVASFFPDKCPADAHSFIKEMTVRNLLTMATPFTATTYSPERTDWVGSFFTTKPSHAPGTVFNYDTSATLVLDAIVERLTGQPFTEYLFDRVLRHIGFKEAPRCVRSPDGFSWGGSGVMCTLPELAAFARFFMNGGKTADGKQLISADYIKAAVSRQICNETVNNFSSYSTYGYGYQVWVTKGGFAFLGMGNQLALCFPESDVLLCTVGDDQGNTTARESLFRLIYKYILEPLSDVALPENGEALAALRRREHSVTLPLPEGEAVSPVAESVDGVWYGLEENPMGIEKIKFDLGESGVMTIVARGHEKRVTFGLGEYDVSVFPETDYFGDTIGVPAGRGYKCRGAGCWAEENKLVIRVYVTDDYFGNMTVTACFLPDGVISLLFKKTAEWFLDEYQGFAYGTALKKRDEI